MATFRKKTSYSWQTAEHFDILIAFLRHHIQELYAIKNVPFFGPPCIYTTISRLQREIMLCEVLSVFPLCIAGLLILQYWYCYQRYRWYFLSIDASFGDTFICSIDIGISDTFSLIFWQYSIPVLLLSDALINSVNNNTTLPKRVKARTVVLHLN